MNDEQRPRKILLVWFVLIFQVVTLAFLISTRLIDADLRNQYQNSIAKYEKQVEQYKQQAEQYEQQTERYTKALDEYEKQQSQYDAQRKQYEKNMEEYKSNLKKWKENIPNKASEAIGAEAATQPQR